MRLYNLTKPIYLIFFLSVVSISAHSAVIKWNIEFVEPVSEGSLETHITGQGSFSYDTGTVDGVTISDDATFIPIYAYDNNGVPYIAYYDSFSESKNDINTLLTDLTINNLGIEWSLNDGVNGFFNPERWWKDDVGTVFHNAGSRHFVGTGADSYFLTNGWEFEKYSSLKPSLFIGHSTINSSTAFGNWVQNSNGNKSEGTWNAQIISTPIPGAFYLFASGVFSLIHLGRKVKTDRNINNFSSID